MYCPGCGKEIPVGYSGPTCPACGATLKMGSSPTSQPAGIPWENREQLGFLPALIGNLRSCLFDPDRFFSDMPKRANLGAALFYVVILGWIGALGGLLWDIAFEGTRRQMLQALGFPGMEQTLAGGMRMVIFMAVAILAPVGILIAVFVVSGILHVMLWILGGAKEGFEATLRTYCYAAGSTSLFQWIPFCGGLVGLVWCLVLQVYGLSRAHEIPAGKAALAVLLPIALCCILIFAVALLFAGFFIALLKGGGSV